MSASARRRRWCTRRSPSSTKGRLRRFRRRRDSTGTGHLCCSWRAYGARVRKRTPGRKINTYQAIDAGAILGRLQERVKDFSDFVPVIRMLANRSGARPKISFFESKEGILNVYESINRTSSAFFITSYARINRHFPGLVEKWLRDFEKKRYKLKGVHIVPDDEGEMKYARRFPAVYQKVRKLAALRDLTMDFSIFDNKLVISSLGERSFHGRYRIRGHCPLGAGDLRGRLGCREGGVTNPRRGVVWSDGTLLRPTSGRATKRAASRGTDTTNETR